MCFIPGPIFLFNGSLEVDENRRSRAYVKIWYNAACSLRWLTLNADVALPFGSTPSLLTRLTFQKITVNLTQKSETKNHDQSKDNNWNVAPKRFLIANY